MTTIGLDEAKTTFTDLVHRAQAGESIRIIDDGKELARLVPPPEVATEEFRQAAENWLKSSKGITLGGLSIRDLINEGRR